MSWLRERVESKAGRTVPLPPRNEPWLPSVLVERRASRRGSYQPFRCACRRVTTPLRQENKRLSSAQARRLLRRPRADEASGHLEAALRLR